MFNFKNVLTVTFLIFASIGLISFFTVSHIHSLRRLNQKEDEISYEFNDEFRTRKLIEEEIKKSKYYKSLERDPIQHLNPNNLEEDEDKSNKFRSLEASNIFDDVALVDPVKENYISISNWVIRNLKQFSSSIVIYPYSFDYNYQIGSENKIKHFEQGSFISLKPSELDPYKIGLKTNNSLSIQKARALFDADIAILSVEGTFEDDDIIEYFHDGIDWCTYLLSVGKPSCLINYDSFSETKQKDTSKTYVTKLNETAIANGALLNNNLPRFGILIIPDFILGVHERLKSRLKDAITKINDFYSKGGVIFLTGKSGALFENTLVKSGTYDTKKLLSVDNTNRRITINGCEDTFNKTYEKNLNDFEKQMICTSMKLGSQVCLSTTFLTKTPDSSFKNLILGNIKQKDLSITDTETAITHEVNADEVKYPHLLSYKKNDKNGQIYLMNFNPMFAGGNKNIILNLIALALSKELYLTSRVNMDIKNSEITDLPIPAGEAGVDLKVQTTIHNLNDEEISKCQLYIFLPDNFGWSRYPDSCKLSNDKSIPVNVKNKRSFESTNDYLLCNIGKITAYEKHNFETTISVLNYKATQMKLQVLILEPIAVFTDSKGNDLTLVDYIRVNCEAAPLLRVSANPDPSSFYPVYGEGEYVDNVIKIENKEQSGAYEVEYVGLIPLISPLLDGDDQRKTQWNLKIYVDYYNTINDFEVPFETDNATDYIYTTYLQGKGSVIVAEWDSPVLPVKEIIDQKRAKESKDALSQEVNIKGINLGMVTIGKTSEIIKQVNYRKSDRFYKLASQRLMVFIDDSTPEGAKTLHGNSIPEEWKDPINPNKAKRDFLFMRNDIYFYKNENYCNPPGADEKIIFSVDKLVEYQKNKPGCAKERGNAESKIIDKGYFDNHKDNHREKILKPNVYSNELFEYCDLTVINATNEESIKQQFGNLEHIRPVHYIIPNVETDITSSKQLYNFVEDNEYSGHHKDYPSIRFLKLHSATFIVDAKRCLYGGKIEISLGTYKISSKEEITVSPDQIAVYKIEYTNDNKINIFFRRGLMSNEQFGKNLTLIINIENINSKENINLNMEFYEMKYDISFPPTYERYNSYQKKDQEFKYITAFSYPALEIKTSLDRNLNGYETMEPFSRYGTYSQELGHRYVFGTAETHHQTHPGLTGNGVGFALISNLGISSIPFIEYMTVGRGQVIPAGTSTARATWKDIWGRTWHQPIRSLFPDVPPIPPPLKNFMMSTTYEILRNGKQIYEWPSDEKAQIHLHIKLLNNYPKYFEITRCKENEIKFVPTKLSENHDRVYSNTSSAQLNDAQIKGDNLFLRQGGYASYGICFSDTKAIVGGKKVEGEFLKQIERAKVCADFTDENMIAECEKELENITTLHRIGEKDDHTKEWNYSPRVESYYPKGYIEPDMWDLTHVDYDDNAMDKAYKYHMDNHLPNYDNEIIKPHNTIAIPIYKGLGFSITYDKNNKMNYHGKEKQGWWGDNLQNKDDTLLAGQETCNTVSVDKTDSITKWVKGTNLIGHNDTTTSNTKNIINERNKNIYVCLYNQNRPQFSSKNTRKYAALNVNQNNIVPIIVDLDRKDPRLTNYNCTENQYTPENLYKMEKNLLVTPTSKDYLYFAANLRGQAKESFNVLLNLENFEKIKYEGMVKVNEGGRFVYWNPANGPNSFLVVDNPVSVINSKRNDIEITNGVFPLKIATFNSVVYHYYTFKDENKINQIWPFSDYYTNSFGFGDVSVSVYVGGIRKSKAVLEKGKTTYARIIFYNNCGFDWNMKKGAIDFEYKGKKPISANDLLHDLVHTIQKPLRYNFLNYIVEDKYKDYIKIGPSDHNIEVAPEFFDFENINVVTIRDGFKGEYNLQINVTDKFPDDLRGKPIEIKIELNTSYFDHFPGTSTDLTTKGYHNYVVKVPSVYIAVPYNSEPFKGKVLYTSAYASNLDLNVRIGVDWEIQGVKFAEKETIDKCINISVSNDNLEEFNKYWKENNNNIDFSISSYSKDLKIIKFNGIKNQIKSFPILNEKGPDKAEITLLIKSKVAQIAKGNTQPINKVYMNYNDWIGKTKNVEGQRPFIEAKGAWITISYTRTLVEQLKDGVYIESANQELSHESEGIMKIHFKLYNSGNGDAFNTTYSIAINSNLTYIGCEGVTLIKEFHNEENGLHNLTFDLKSPILASQTKGGYIYVRYKKVIESYSNLTIEELDGLPSTLDVANESSATMDLEKENNITQILRQPLVFSYQKKKGSIPYIDLVVSGRRSNPDVEVIPKIKLENDTLEDILVNITKMDLTVYEDGLNETNNVKMLVKNKKKPGKAEDKPITKEFSNKNHEVIYTVSIKRKDKSFAQNKIAYKQKEIGITTPKIILIIISIVLYGIAAFFIWAGCKNMKLINSGGILDKQVNDSNLDRLLNE